MHIRESRKTISKISLREGGREGIDGKAVEQRPEMEGLFAGVCSNMV